PQRQRNGITTLGRYVCSVYVIVKPLQVFEIDHRIETVGRIRIGAVDVSFQRYLSRSRSWCRCRRWSWSRSWSCGPRTGDANENPALEICVVGQEAPDL